MRNTAGAHTAKWTAADYDHRRLIDWRPPKLVYPCSESEKERLHTLKNDFAPREPYTHCEAEARADDTLVTIGAQIPDGYYAFLENTAEKCTSPQTKHSSEGMQGARHWVQRVDTQAGLFRRLTDGYGISLMFGERFHQFIRNSHNWRGTSGTMLDIDVFRDDKHPDRPEPVYSLDALFSRYPLLADICAFILPSASSLYEGRPFKARGIILFPEPITDMRVYRAFGDILLAELDCIPHNVTKNPVAVGFGNTHNAPQACRNDTPNVDWIQASIAKAEQKVNETRPAKRRDVQTRQQAFQKSRRTARLNGKNGFGTGENISAFIEKCDPVSEMVRDGLLTPEHRDRYKWHQSESAGSCEIRDGVIKIFSETMAEASPTGDAHPINAHRFYLYYTTGLDFTDDTDKQKCRDYLFSKGYGTDPKAFAKKRERTPPKLQKKNSDAVSEPTETREANEALRERGITDALNAELAKTQQTHLTLVTDVTGSGKSHTTLAKAKALGKRPIGITPHKDLADQAVDLARRLGFQSPMHLRGRGQNWHESGIAEIPVSDRTEALFEKNLCILHDELEKHTEKRLAAGEFCFRMCPFLGVCPYWKQYETLKNADAVFTCTPNILFDPAMLGYLRRLVKSESPSETDDALAASLGTAPDITDDFDMAIVDDYTVASLYNEQQLTLSEVKRLIKDWKGYALGNFAKEIAEVFLCDTPAEIYQHIEKTLAGLDPKKRKALRKQMTKHPRWGHLEAAERPLASKETEKTLSEWDIVFEDGGRAKVAKNAAAYLELIQKDIPAVRCRDDWTVGDRVMIPYTPFGALKAGVNLSDLAPVWQRRWTLLHQLQHFVRGVKLPLNAPIKIENETLHFTTPPRANALIPNIFLLSATTDPSAVRQAFSGQKGIKWTELTGTPIQWAAGVSVYQFSQHRITSASTLEYQTDPDGKRQLQSAPIGLTPTTEKRFQKLNRLAQETQGVKVFISYKDIADTPAFREKLNAFDIVTHFDRVEGLNIDNLSLLVVYGYPKVSHQVVMNAVRIQFANADAPLPDGDYETLTELSTYTEAGLEITERRYIDERLDTIRHQLATDKLIQAVGRARLPRWTDTDTVIFTNAPLPSITPRAFLFGDREFHASDTRAGMAETAVKIEKAIADGDVEAIQEIEGVAERTAYRKTQNARDAVRADRDAEIIRLHTDEHSTRKIAEIMTKNGYEKVSVTTVRRVVNEHKTQARQKCQAQLGVLIGNDKNGAPPESVAEPCLDAKKKSTPPVASSESSKLTEADAIAAAMAGILQLRGDRAHRNSEKKV